MAPVELKTFYNNNNRSMGILTSMFEISSRGQYSPVQCSHDLLSGSGAKSIES